jgi:hypothetical protein
VPEVFSESAQKLSSTSSASKPKKSNRTGTVGNQLEVHLFINNIKTVSSPSGVFLLMGDLRLQFLGRALAALR